mmetsp:Transcript_5436/g.7575  ORF Transcript_5436/g.7575 Transcript_5436/m.7575 type:complete len:328 (+) Transcript_5436:2019-3002(+)
MKSPRRHWTPHALQRQSKYARLTWKVDSVPATGAGVFKNAFMRTRVNEGTQHILVSFLVLRTREIVHPPDRDVLIRVKSFLSGGRLFLKLNVLLIVPSSLFVAPVTNQRHKSSCNETHPNIFLRILLTTTILCDRCIAHDILHWRLRRGRPLVIHRHLNTAAYEPLTKVFSSFPGEGHVPVRTSPQFRGPQGSEANPPEIPGFVIGDYNNVSRENFHHAPVIHVRRSYGSVGIGHIVMPYTDSSFHSRLFRCPQNGRVRGHLHAPSHRLRVSHSKQVFGNSDSGTRLIHLAVEIPRFISTLENDLHVSLQKDRLSVELRVQGEGHWY